jgi:hypothetical protein
MFYLPLGTPCCINTGEMSVIRFEQANALTNFGTASFDLNFGAGKRKDSGTAPPKLAPRAYNYKEVKFLLHLVQEQTSLAAIVIQLNERFHMPGRLERNPKGVRSKIAGDIIYGMYYGFKFGTTTFNFKHVFVETFVEALGIDEEAAKKYVKTFIFSMWSNDVDVEHNKRRGIERITMFTDDKTIDERSKSTTFYDAKVRYFKAWTNSIRGPPPARSIWDQTDNPFHPEEDQHNAGRHDIDLFEGMKLEIGKYANLDQYIISSPGANPQYDDWAKKTVWLFQLLVNRAIGIKVGKGYKKTQIDPYMITRVLEKSDFPNRNIYPSEYEIEIIEKCIDKYQFPLSMVGPGDPPSAASRPAHAGLPYIKEHVIDIVAGLKANQSIKDIANRPGVARTENGLKSKIQGDFINHILKNENSKAYKGIIQFLIAYDIHGAYAKELIAGTMPALWASADKGDTSLDNRITIFEV